MTKARKYNKLGRNTQFSQFTVIFLALLIRTYSCFAVDDKFLNLCITSLTNSRSKVKYVDVVTILNIHVKDAARERELNSVEKNALRYSVRSTFVAFACAAINNLSQECYKNTSKIDSIEILLAENSETSRKSLFALCHTIQEKITWTRSLQVSTGSIAPTQVPSGKSLRPLLTQSTQPSVRFLIKNSTIAPTLAEPSETSINPSLYTSEKNGTLEPTLPPTLSPLLAETGGLLHFPTYSPTNIAPEITVEPTYSPTHATKNSTFSIDDDTFQHQNFYFAKFAYIVELADTGNGQKTNSSYISNNINSNGIKASLYEAIKSVLSGVDENFLSSLQSEKDITRSAFAKTSYDRDSSKSKRESIFDIVSISHETIDDTECPNWDRSEISCVMFVSSVRFFSPSLLKLDPPSVMIHVIIESMSPHSNLISNLSQNGYIFRTIFSSNLEDKKMDSVDRSGDLRSGGSKQVSACDCNSVLAAALIPTLGATLMLSVVVMFLKYRNKSNSVTYSFGFNDDGSEISLSRHSQFVHDKLENLSFHDIEAMQQITPSAPYGPFCSSAPHFIMTEMQTPSPPGLLNISIDAISLQSDISSLGNSKLYSPMRGTIASSMESLDEPNITKHNLRNYVISLIRNIAPAEIKNIDEILRVFADREDDLLEMLQQSKTQAFKSSASTRDSIDSFYDCVSEGSECGTITSSSFESDDCFHHARSNLSNENESVAGRVFGKSPKSPLGKHLDASYLRSPLTKSNVEQKNTPPDIIDVDTASSFPLQQKAMDVSGLSAESSFSL